MSRKSLFLVLAVALLHLLSVETMAGVTDVKAANPKLAPGQRLKTNPQLQLARRFMASQDYQSAADILEVLYSEDPENLIIANSLKSCYEILKLYSKGELLLRRLAERFPKNISYRINLAENLVRQGKTDEGKKIYAAILTDNQSVNPISLTNVVRSMINSSLEDDALELIESIRKQSGDSTAMAIERAGILKGKRLYYEASFEYFKVLDDTTHLGNTSEKNLSALLDFNESSEITETALLEKADNDSTGRVSRVLSTYYLKTSRYDDAYRFAIKQDSASGFGGASLLQYLRGCMERRLYPQAIQMAEYVIVNLKGKPYVREFYYRYAESLEEMGRYNDAISVYDSIFTGSPRAQDKAEATYRIGRIRLDRLNDPETALVYFDSVRTHYLVGFAYHQAVTSIPHAYLRMGDLPKARSEFSKLSRTKYNREASEQIAYYLALLDFYEYNYDSCVAGMKKLTVDYPRGYFVNDAVQLLFLIDQAGGAVELLNSFADALLFQQMRKHDSAVAYLTDVAEAKDKSLADIALFRLTELVLHKGDSLGAVAHVDQMSEQFPDSYYLPYGLKYKADILFTGDMTRKESVEIYRQLLEDYPNYPFINEVREKMRQLEVDAETS